MEFQQSFSDDLIHRDVAGLAALGLGDNQTVAAEVNLPPFQVQDFAPPHTCVEGQNDDRSQI
jgi:hypothetical protein